jgi:hypothetical protein
MQPYYIIRTRAEQTECYRDNTVYVITVCCNVGGRTRICIIIIMRPLNIDQVYVEIAASKNRNNYCRPLDLMIYATYARHRVDQS